MFRRERQPFLFLCNSNGSFSAREGAEIALVEKALTALGTKEQAARSPSSVCASHSPFVLVRIRCACPSDHRNGDIRNTEINYARPYVLAGKPRGVGPEKPPRNGLGKPRAHDRPGEGDTVSKHIRSASIRGRPRFPLGEPWPSIRVEKSVDRRVLGSAGSAHPVKRGRDLDGKMGEKQGKGGPPPCCTCNS